MPELPEVQTIISDLNRKIKGDTIVGFWSDWPKAIKNIKLNNFEKEIKNQKILGARRIGKNIFIDLSGGKTLYIHLKMTGHLLVKPATSPQPSPYKGEGVNKKNYFNDKVNQYIHHIWKLKSGRTLEFSDLRKFGKIVLDDTDKIASLKEIKSLGVDAMSLDFTYEKFLEILNRFPKKIIGILLMEQNLIAGIGNIYRSEILFDAGIIPTRKTGDISDKKRQTLYKSIQKILKKAIKYRGTSDSDYRDTAGALGGYQEVSMVYNREKQKCHASRQAGKICGTIIRREKLGQRSIFFCPKCQK